MPGERFSMMMIPTSTVSLTITYIITLTFTHT